MLKATDRAKGSAGVLRGRDSSGGTKMEPPENDAPTLSDLGINKKTSSLEPQKLAKLPEAEVTAIKTSVRTGNSIPQRLSKCLTKTRLNRASKEVKNGQDRGRIIETKPVTGGSGRTGVISGKNLRSEDARGFRGRQDDDPQIFYHGTADDKTVTGRLCLFFPLFFR